MVGITKNQKNVILAIILNMGSLACIAWLVNQLIALTSSRTGSQLTSNDLTLSILHAIPLVALLVGYMIGFRVSNNKLIAVIAASIFSLSLFILILALDIVNTHLSLFTNLTTWTTVYALISMALVAGAYWYSRSFANRK